MIDTNANTSLKPFPYRAELDGIRALAIVFVIGFHYFESWFVGGFLGVDVFFVVSGFLITSLIWERFENKTFTFTDFWERRARRIIPPLLVMLFAVIAAGCLCLQPIDLKALGWSAQYVSLFSANIYFLDKANYFAPDSIRQPLLHTWSLAVEEQFYLCMPILLWLLFRFFGRRNRTVSAAVLLIGMVVSFTYSFWLSETSFYKAFYILPARAWELFLGGALCFAPALDPRMRHAQLIRQLGAGFGLVLMLVTMFIVSQSTGNPALCAVGPCLGASLLIWCNHRLDSGIPTVVGQLLAAKPLVWIGIISYSLYLWHWPLLSFAYQLSANWESVRELKVGLIGLTFLLAVLSWKFVENPIRHRSATYRFLFLPWAGLGMVTGLCFGQYAVSLGESRYDPLEYAMISDQNAVKQYRQELTAENVSARKIIKLGDVRKAPTVLVWGDSHAMAVLPAVNAFLLQRGLAGCAAVRFGTAPVLGWKSQKTSGNANKSVLFNDAVFEMARQDKIHDVLIVGYWHMYMRSSEKRRAEFRAKLLDTVQRLKSVGITPWVMLDVPIQRFNVPRELSRHPLAEVEKLQLPSSVVDPLVAGMPDFIKTIESRGGRVMNPRPRFLSPGGSYYIVQKNGIPLYRDDHHLSRAGSLWMIFPLLQEEFLLPAHTKSGGHL